MQKPIQKDRKDVHLIRILSTDIPSDKNIYAGLTKIKGVSWSFSNALCNSLKIDKNKKVYELSPEDIKNISDFIKKPKLPAHLLNRRKDLDEGSNLHLSTSDLELRKEFDIKRLKKIRSYRGLRHATGQPVRGQSTRAHFRKNKSVGVLKKGKKGKKG
ncbi:MAG: 30S ribosomal protein S13 [archaeon]